MNKLEGLLYQLEVCGTMTREFEQVEREIKMACMDRECGIKRNITVMCNDLFKVEYSMDQNEMIFETTYGNRKIDDTFIQKMIFVKSHISDIKREIEDLYDQFLKEGY